MRTEILKSLDMICNFNILNKTDKIKFMEKHPERIKKFQQKHLSLNKISKDIRSLKKLKITKKEDIRKQPLKKGLRKVSTSGSTGKPLIFTKDKIGTSWDWANKIRNWERTGYTLGDDMIYIFRNRMFESKLTHIVRQIRNFMNNTSSINMLSYTPQTIKKWINTIEKKQPKLLRGVTSPTFIIAETLINKEKTIPINATITTGEQLTKPMRKIIEEAFETKLYDDYGTNEIQSIAHQCEKGHYHVMETNVILEEIKNNLIVTSLHHGKKGGTKFVRYETGDTGIIKNIKCSCGIKGKIIKELTGRTGDYIITPENNKIAFQGVASIFNNEKGLLQYRLIQDKNNLNIIYHGTLDKNSVNLKIKKYLSTKFKTTFEKTDKPLKMKKIIKRI